MALSGGLQGGRGHVARIQAFQGESPRSYSRTSVLQPLHIGATFLLKFRSLELCPICLFVFVEA